MSDIWMDVDTNITVPVNLLPLIDDGDFKAIEAAVVFNAAGLVLVWNFVTTAGVQTQTALTPTNTGGAYDWTNLGNGMYKVELPATSETGPKNDTEGFGWFSGVATGVLPWRGPVVGFRAAVLNNSLVDGTTIDVNLTKWLGVEPAALTATGKFVQAILMRHLTDDAAGTPLALTAARLVQVDAIAAADSAGVTTILADYAPIGAAMTLANDAITANTFDETTAFPLKAADSGSTYVFRTGADGDTGKTLSDQIDGVGGAAGPGAVSWPITITDADSNLLDGVSVWVSTDIGGTNVIASGYTAATGIVTFMLDAGTYYAWKQLAGYSFTNPESFTVTE